MEYDFNRVIDRRESDSDKWNHYPADVLPMWVADMDFRSPEPVIQALLRRVEQGIFGYPVGLSAQTRIGQEFGEILAARLADRYGWEIQLEDLVYLPGVVTGFNLACHAFGKPGGKVFMQTPVYHPFLSAPRNAGLERQEMQLSLLEDGSYGIDMERFEQSLDTDTSLFILCNPHNPVGRVFRQDELVQMAEICLRNNVLICSDEIHCDLVYSGHKHIPIASLDREIAQNTVTLMSPSKTFNIAGLQCSFAIIQNASLRRKFIASHQGLVGWINLMGLTAGIAAYRDGNDWLEQLLIYLEGNRNFLYQFLRKELPQIGMAIPEATYLAWLDCRKLTMADPYHFFLDEAKVAFNDGKLFGAGGQNYVRLNFGCPRSTLETALVRMKKALEKIQ
jgi:cystathionine beta-lyase